MSTILKNKQFLIVEDALPILQIVKTVLNGVGAYSDGVGSIDRAQDMVLRKNYDVVILDRYLEGEDGHDFLKFLKKTSAIKDIPVVMLSGEKEMGEIKASVELGAVGYIVKPFSANDFLDQLIKILRRTSAVDLEFK